MGNYNWVHGFTLDFDKITGQSNEATSTKRYLSGMKGMYYDEKAEQELIKSEDPLVYEFYELGAPDKKSDLAYGTSITYSGQVRDEYFMTKGHFHSILETAEVYYCLSGEGYMLLENPEGDWSTQKLSTGKSVYVPARYAHRSINTGSEPMVTFFCFRGDAGHDYGTIETKGYRKLLLNCDGEVKVVDNPKWK